MCSALESGWRPSQSLSKDAVAPNALRRDLQEVLQTPSRSDFHCLTRHYSFLNRSDKSFAFSASPNHG
jgi:hypothetical protein